jgi:hypothetical protein
MTRASMNQEGKIHMGFVYSNDQTYKTGEKILFDAMNFSYCMEKLLNKKLDWKNSTSKEFLYLVPKSSLVSEKELDLYFEHLQQTYIKIINDEGFCNHKNRYYITTKGIETILHIFNNIIFYTNNPNIAEYHSIRAIYLYKEYISQIVDESNSFLNLNTRDSILFIYKKTIFDIKKEHFKTIINNEYKNTFDCLYLHGIIIKLCISFLYDKQLKIQRKILKRE